jgi:hypothetical protein
MTPRDVLIEVFHLADFEYIIDDYIEPGTKGFEAIYKAMERYNESEIIRLKNLIEQEFRKTFRGFGIREYIDKEWQQFKKENNL